MITGIPSRATLEARMGRNKYREKLKEVEASVSRCRNREDVCALLAHMGWEPHEIQLFCEIAYNAQRARRELA